MAPGRPNETYGRVKIPFGPINQIISHWFQLPGATLEWPPITRPGVNATKYRKPWPRTDIIVRWPHDCLSPIMRWPLPKPGQTVSGGALQHFRRIANWLQSDIWQGNEITETCVQFPKLVSWAWSLHCTVQCTAECKKGGFNWQTWSKWAACEFVLRKIIQLNASLHRNWGKNELLEKGGRAGSLWQKWS